MKRLITLILLLPTILTAQDMWMDVDVAVTVPVSLMPLVDQTDGYTIEDAVVYNEAGMAVVWNFVTLAGAMTTTDFTLTTGGNHDWIEEGTNRGMYSIEIPASGSAQGVDNDTEGFGWISGETSTTLPFRGPVIGFRKASMNDLMVEDGTAQDNIDAMYDGAGYGGGTIELQVDAKEISADATIADNLQTIAAALLEVFSTDYATNYDTTNNMWNVDAEKLNGNDVPVTTAQLISDGASAPTNFSAMNITATGNVGIDWANVENPTTAVDLSATDIQLVDTVTTYTGNTVQTGDSFSYLGTNLGALGANATEAGGTGDHLTELSASIAAGSIVDVNEAQVVEKSTTRYSLGWWLNAILGNL